MPDAHQATGILGHHPHVKLHCEIQRIEWGEVILLGLISVAIVVRCTAQRVPILINGYAPPARAG
jgi:hypothetical protein